MTKFRVEMTKKCRNDRVSKRPGVETTGYPSLKKNILIPHLFEDIISTCCALYESDGVRKECWINMNMIYNRIVK